LFVHDYLTVDGTKISKSLGNAVDPVALADRFGTDALRWWLLRNAPRGTDADFTVAGLVDTANRDLANGVGNVVRRVATLAQLRSGVEFEAPAADEGVRATSALRAAAAELPARVDRALERFDFRSALEAVTDTVAEVNRLLEATRPWENTAERCDVAPVLREAVSATRVVARELEPFVPGFAQRARLALGADGVPPAPTTVLFPRLRTD
jgi:methionyl-tRNA synthetase